jgi:hypothetical protein
LRAQRSCAVQSNLSTTGVHFDRTTKPSVKDKFQSGRVSENQFDDKVVVDQTPDGSNDTINPMREATWVASLECSKFKR